jgi:hypothetical protein
VVCVLNDDGSVKPLNEPEYIILEKNYKKNIKQMKQKKIYIAGKISGLPEEMYKEKFGVASLNLQLEGYLPQNPVEICSDIESDDWSDYIEYCLEVLSACDGIYLLNDWQESRSARIEKKVAEIIKSYNPDFEIMEETL